MKLCYLGLQFHKSRELYSKNVSAKHEKLPFQLLIRETQVTPRTVKAAVVKDGCLPEVECKSLLLKVQPISDKGLGGIELDLTQTPSPED